MTTVELFRSAVAHPTTLEVPIAGVPWPAYKVLALVIGLLVGAVALVTAGASAAVLGGAAAATVVWLAAGFVSQHR